MFQKNNNGEDGFGIFIIISVALHSFVFILFTYGLPSIFTPLPEPQVVTFEILPVDAISNVKTQKIQQEKEIEEQSAKKIQKTKQEEAPDPKKEDNAKAEENRQESKRDFDEKKPDDKRELVSMKSAEDKKKEEKKKSDKAQEKQVKDDKKPKKKKLPTEKEMDALLKTLEKASEGNEEKSAKRAMSSKSDAKQDSMGQYNEDKPLSISEEQAIRQQIERNWNVPSGVQNAGDIIITLYIALKVDGTVDQVKLVESRCPGGMETVCRAATDSAIRAVRQASPLQNLSSVRYDSWKEVQLSFDPRDVLGM